MKALDNIEGLFSAKLGVIKAVFSLIKLEARLAGLSVFPLLLNLCMLFVVLISAWVSVMLLLAIALFSLVDSLLITASIILVLNLCLLLGLVKYLSFNLKNLSFAQTRAYFSNKESDDYDKLANTADTTDCTNQQSAAMPTSQGDTA